VVCPESFEALVQGIDNVISGATPVIDAFADTAAKFGGQDDFVAFIFKGIAQEFL
jgi:hypothetical protein